MRRPWAPSGPPLRCGPVVPEQERLRRGRASRPPPLHTHRGGIRVSARRIGRWLRRCRGRAGDATARRVLCRLRHLGRRSRARPCGSHCAGRDGDVAGRPAPDSCARAAAAPGHQSHLHGHSRVGCGWVCLSGCRPLRLAILKSRQPVRNQSRGGGGAGNRTRVRSRVPHDLYERSPGIALTGAAPWDQALLRPVSVNVPPVAETPAGGEAACINVGSAVRGRDIGRRQAEA